MYVGPVFISLPEDPLPHGPGLSSYVLLVHPCLTFLPFIIVSPYVTGAHPDPFELCHLPFPLDWLVRVLLCVVSFDLLHHLINLSLLLHLVGLHSSRPRWPTTILIPGLVGMLALVHFKNFFYLLFVPDPSPTLTIPLLHPFVLFLSYYFVVYSFDQLNRWFNIEKIILNFFFPIKFEENISLGELNEMLNKKLIIEDPTRTTTNDHLMFAKVIGRRYSDYFGGHRHNIQNNCLQLMLSRMQSFDYLKVLRLLPVSFTFTFTFVKVMIMSVVWCNSAVTLLPARKSELDALLELLFGSNQSSQPVPVWMAYYIFFAGLATLVFILQPSIYFRRLFLHYLLALVPFLPAVLLLVNRVCSNYLDHYYNYDYLIDGIALLLVVFFYHHYYKLIASLVLQLLGCLEPSEVATLLESRLQHYQLNKPNTQLDRLVLLDQIRVIASVHLYLSRFHESLCNDLFG